MTNIIKFPDTSEVTSLKKEDVDEFFKNYNEAAVKLKLNHLVITKEQAKELNNTYFKKILDPELKKIKGAALRELILEVRSFLNE